MATLNHSRTGLGVTLATVTTLLLAAMAHSGDALAVCAAGHPNANMAESTPTSAFTDHGNGTVTHKLTGLMWKKCSQGQSGASCEAGTATRFQWGAALASAVNDSTGGYTDWRLPNMLELQSIVELCGWGPAINQTVFPATPGAQFDFFFSSTTHLPAPRASGIGMLDGSPFILSKASSIPEATFFARLVRGGRTPDAFDAQPPMLTVSKTGSGTGGVTSVPAGIDCGATCSAAFALNTSVTLTATATGGSTFSGWLGACTGTGSCVVTIKGATNVSATFAPNALSLRADVDGNSIYDALTDGLMVVRYLSGLTGNSLIDGAIGLAPTRSTAADVLLFLVNTRPILDIDGNGLADANTDGLLLVRYLFGLRGAGLTAGAIGAGATRTTDSLIETYIQSILPP